MHGAAEISHKPRSHILIEAANVAKLLTALTISRYDCRSRRAQDASKCRLSFNRTDVLMLRIRTLRFCTEVVLVSVRDS